MTAQELEDLRRWLRQPVRERAYVPPPRRIVVLPRLAIDKGTSAPVGPYQITVLSSAAGTAVFRVVASS